MKKLQMPIAPAAPGSRATDGRILKPEYLDALLNYDPLVREAILKLDSFEAHGNHQSGPKNQAVLGRVTRTYSDGTWIYAEVEPSIPYEHILESLCGPTGGYPNRSLELDSIYIEGKQQYWLEAVSLCGSERPALNLPPISVIQANESQHQALTFSVSFADSETSTEPAPLPTTGQIDSAIQKLQRQISDLSGQRAVVHQVQTTQERQRQEATEKQRLEDATIRNEAVQQIRNESHGASPYLSLIKARTRHHEDKYLRQVQLGRRDVKSRPIEHWEVLTDSMDEV
ncbi:hypothetical protein L0244_28400, partial [bacterium]|nr:hypothetical protein [bacterium]